MNPLVSSAIMGKFNPLAGVANVVCWLNHRDVAEGPVVQWRSRLGPYYFSSSVSDERPLSTYEGILFDGIQSQGALNSGTNTGTRHVFIKLLCVDVKVTYLLRLRDSGIPVLEIVGNSGDDYDGSLRLTSYSGGAVSIDTSPGSGFEPGNLLVIHAAASASGLKLWTNFGGEDQYVGDVPLEDFNSVGIGFLNSEPGFESSGFPNQYYKEIIVVGGDMTTEQIDRVKEYLTLNV